MTEWMVVYDPHAPNPFQPIIVEADAWLTGTVVPVAYPVDDKTADLICKLYNESLRKEK